MNILKNISILILLLFTFSTIYSDLYAVLRKQRREIMKNNINSVSNATNFIKDFVKHNPQFSVHGYSAVTMANGMFLHVFILVDENNKEYVLCLEPTGFASIPSEVYNQ